MAAMTPDVIVAIDFGMTCTGVAYSTGPDWGSPQTIQKWPGTNRSALLNKVPTVIAYKPDTDDVVKWGAEVDLTDQQIELERLFKLYLDPRYDPTREDAPSVKEAQLWFKDYLSCIYKHVMQHITNTFPRSAQKRFEFLFSTPTGWNEPSMINDITKLIYAAGFGSQANHTVTISATEAEAAAIYTSKRGYGRGDVILVCDAGGGTTDVHVFKVVDAARGRTALTPLTYVEGDHVGSGLINFEVRKLINEKLKLARWFVLHERNMISDRIMKEGTVEAYKCAFNLDNPLDLILHMKEMERVTDSPDIDTAKAKIKITHGEFKAIFDEQIRRMFKLVDKQLDDVQREYSNEKVNWMVLSGGLGSSEYVQERFRNRYVMNAGGGKPNAGDINLLIAADPQLAVVHGLVLGRTQELLGSAAVFTERRARNSYGVLCRQVYDPKLHLRQPVVKDSRDGFVYAEGQIEWLVKQGEPIDIERGLQKDYSYKVDLGQTAKPWKVQIVMSESPKNRLPHSIKQQDVKIICTLAVTVDAAELKQQNHRWYHRKDEYSLAEFTIKVMVGYADLQFSVLSKNNNRKVYTGNTKIAVEWM